LTDHNKISISRYPFRVCRYAYHKDLLIVRSAEIKEVHGAALTNESLFVVGPVYRDVDQSELSEIETPTLNAAYLCNYFLVGSREREQPRILAKIFRRSNPDEKKWIDFQEAPEQINVGVEGQFIYDVANEIMNWSSD
jgi:hypothetical protein